MDQDIKTAMAIELGQMIYTNTIESLKDQLEGAREENARLLAANRDNMDHFNALMDDLTVAWAQAGVRYQALLLVLRHVGLALPPEVLQQANDALSVDNRDEVISMLLGEPVGEIIHIPGGLYEGSPIPAAPYDLPQFYDEQPPPGTKLYTLKEVK